MNHTRRFGDVAAAVSKLFARTLVLDGEVAIYDQQLRSRFDWLREPDPDAVASPPLLRAFDLLYFDRRDLTGRPLRDRRARLEDVVAGSELVFPVRAPTASTPGPSCSSAATMAWWRRMRRARTKAGARSPS